MTSDARSPASGPAAAAILPLVFGDDAGALHAAFQARVEAGATDDVLPLLRVAALQPSRTTRWYQRLYNLWDTLGRPALKPNATRKRLVLLSNHTTDHLPPLVALHAAALGLDLDVTVEAYDSVELQAFQPDSSLYRTNADFIAVMLSPHWLQRQFGTGALVALDAVQRAEEMLRRVCDALVAHSRATVLVSTFAPPADLPPGSALVTDRGVGWTAALARLNTALLERQNERVAVVDVAAAMHLHGGATACSPAMYLRAKIPWTPAGSQAIAHELAITVAALSGKSHRAVVTDFDNTLWGGEVGDRGFHGIVCGQEDPDALGYYMLQEFLKGLPRLGVLLAGASKNAPEMANVFDENPNVPLARTDFASMHVSWEPKSFSISKISADLGFGPEYMLFLDDSPFELAEALGHHPYLDVLLVGKTPDRTLAALTAGRFFHQVRLTEADSERQAWMTAQRESDAYRDEFADYDSYLQAIGIRLTVSPLHDGTRARILQLLQRTNQFNLTTRRHGEAELTALLHEGAVVACFAYEDNFGPQGVIGVVILLPRDDAVLIDTWLMSCRVLNRTVEQAMLQWMLGHAAGRPLRGTYRPTEKNGIVRDLFDRLGFTHTSDSDEGETRWEWTAGPETAPPHHVTLVEADPNAA